MSGGALRPDSVPALQQAMDETRAARHRVTSVDLSALSQVVAFSPEDMTVTVETGITVDVLQQTLAAAGQWLPIDPPHGATTSLADVLHHDISGPRRLAYGSIREHVLGMAAVLGDGRLIRSGGRVVKNVAGYDLAKLLIGDGMGLGVIVEATFKLSPRPASERFFTWSSSSPEAVDATLARLLTGPSEPVLLDAHNLDASWSVVVGYAGHADDVGWQAGQLEGHWQPLDGLPYEAQFWSDRMFATTARASVLPSRVVEHLPLPEAGPFVARAGNGVIYGDGLPEAAARTPSSLERRLKATYDPHDILPVLR